MDEKKKNNTMACSPKLYPIAGGNISCSFSLVLAVCLLLYVFGAFQNSPSLDFTVHHSQELTPQQALPSLQACDLKYSEYTPCEDVEHSLKFERERLIYRERHCPAKEEQLRCLIPAPPGYRNPFPWPISRDFAWFANVPHKELTIEKAVQNWVQFEDDKFHFPGGGTMFPNGAQAYIHELSSLIPLTDGSIRTALDTGCGVASWGAYLLDLDIISMSIAPRDTHEAQIQFALERGVPAMLGVMASNQLPFPARAFDMAHCSRCLISWKDYDGLYLIEIDRILRPGGYWILSGPPINWKTHWNGWQRTEADLKEEQDAIENITRLLCWTKVVEKGNFAIWQKPWSHEQCFETQELMFPLCNGDEYDADIAWYKKMETCITPLPHPRDSDGTNEGSNKLMKWPLRLTAVPPRIMHRSMDVITAQTFQEDTNLWMACVSHYINMVIPPLGEKRYRNIMDMSADLGGFAAALMVLSNNSMWVMNAVSPVSKYNTLGLIYERGLIGTYQDWCEAFSTYPRTYDLIHANGLFSIYHDRCEMVDILLEMDRILRPEGAVVVRDKVDVLNKLRRYAVEMRWKTEMKDDGGGPLNDTKILVAVKMYWVGSNSRTTTSNSI